MQVLGCPHAHTMLTENGRFYVTQCLDCGSTLREHHVKDRSGYCFFEAVVFGILAGIGFWLFW